MRRQKNILNERTGDNARKKINKMEASNLLDTKFKTLVKRILNELKERVDELGENFNKDIVNIEEDIETIKNNYSEIKIQ